MTEPVWLGPTLLALRGRTPLGHRAASGISGVTHCGRVFVVPWNARHRYGKARLVCVGAPLHDGEHENREGWRWSGTRAPYQVRGRTE